MACRVFNQHLLWQTEEKSENLVRICDVAEILPNSPCPYRCCFVMYDTPQSAVVYISGLITLCVVAMTRIVLNLASFGTFNEWQTRVCTVVNR